jgi:hypothetical protein
VKSSKDARAVLEREGVLMLTPIAGLTSIVESIAKGKVKGSWWGHPAGKQIFRVASELEDMDGVWVIKLVDGKTTFVDRTLHPAIYRIATDRAWRRSRVERLGAKARALFAALPLRRSIRADELDKSTKKAREEIERALLVHSASEHTERGAHISVLTPWSVLATSGLKTASRRLRFEEAVAMVRKACAGAPCVLVDER